MLNQLISNALRVVIDGALIFNDMLHYIHERRFDVVHSFFLSITFSVTFFLHLIFGIYIARIKCKFTIFFAFLLHCIDLLYNAMAKIQFHYACKTE